MSYLRWAAAALLACAGIASGEPSTETRTLPQWVLRAQERLALKPAQQRELRALMDQSAARLRDLQARFVAEPSGDARRAQREEIAELQHEFRAGLAQILSTEQMAEWDELLEELLGEVHLRNLALVAERTH